MHQPTFDADPASILFNLPGYRVICVTPAVGDMPRQVTVETIGTEDACPSCGVPSGRIQARPVQQVKDVTCGGERLDVLVRKRRYVCAESACPRATFTEQTDQLPARARVTTRLAQQVITACRLEPRAVSRVADEAGLAWPTVMRLLTATIEVVTAVDTRHVRHLGIDGHRFRSVRYLRDPDTNAVTRIEPWSIVFTDLDTGAILDVVDGRRGKTVTTWVAARPRWWRRRVQLVAIDMSGEFRAAIRRALPKAKISVDHWHVVCLANEMLTKVRRRRVWELHARRGRNVDTPWKYRKLLTCAGNRLTVRQRAKLTQILDQDIELAVAWGIKEHVRQLLAARDTASFQREWAALERALKATRMPEPATLLKTLTFRAASATDTSPDSTLSTIRVLVSGLNTDGRPMVRSSCSLDADHALITGLPESLTRDSRTEVGPPPTQQPEPMVAPTHAITGPQRQYCWPPNAISGGPQASKYSLVVDHGADLRDRQIVHQVPAQLEGLGHAGNERAVDRQTLQEPAAAAPGGLGPRLGQRRHALLEDPRRTSFVLTGEPW